VIAHPKTLYEKTEEMSFMLVTDNLLNRLAKAAVETTMSDVAVVLMADRQDNVVRLAGGYNLSVRGMLGLSVPIDENSFCGSIVMTGENSILRDLGKLETPIRSLIDACGTRTALGVPIMVGAEATGMILLGSSGRKYASNVLTTAQALADLAAVSYERDRLLSDLTQEIHELKWLARITDKIRLEESEDKVIAAVLEAGSEVLNSDAMVLYLLEEGQSVLHCASTIGIPASFVEPKFEKQHTALLKAIGMQEPLNINDLRALSEGDPFRQLILDINIRSVLGVQLSHRERPMGLLMALFRRPDAGAEIRSDLCRMLALDAAVALNYSRLLEQSRSLIRELEEANSRWEQQAVQDGLTGLANHRAFHQRLTESVHRVGRYGETFSLAMLDVDHFKAYNDAYGHQEGDFALQHIARLIKEELRESDLAARYGGEEFAIILPHTPKAHARIALERIRKSIDTFQFPNGKLTISAGIAECPVDGITPNEVLEKADRALYHSKLTGRNRVSLWADANESPARQDSASDCKSVSVLMVEMNQEAREAMEKALVESGYELHRASSTHEAIELLRSRKFDIMLSDTLILGTEGLQVLGLASSIHPMMPIVLTTVPSMANIAREAMQHGVTDLLVEPFNENELPVVIERNLERKRIERQLLLEKSTGILLQAIDALVAAIDARDRNTAGHTARVTHISLAIADALGLPSEERYTLELAARLHDIGKLSLPDSAMNKAGTLSNTEWQAMQRHPAVGSQIVGSIEELSYIATIVRHHHERLDGKGYPDGLQGEAIPFLSRIIAVADAFEAMTSDRAFRSRMTTEEAVEELKRCVGTHYSSEIVEALIESLKIGALDNEQLDKAA